MDAISRTTFYRRKRQAKALGIEPEELPDNRGKHGNHTRGKNHYRWNDKSIITSNNYRLVRVGIGHPLAHINGYALEHHLVWVSAGNRLPILNQEAIHHKNGDALDNRIENLSLVNLKDHFNYHVNHKEPPPDLMVREMPR